MSNATQATQQPKQNQAQILQNPGILQIHSSASTQSQSRPQSFNQRSMSQTNLLPHESHSIVSAQPSQSLVRPSSSSNSPSSSTFSQMSNIRPLTPISEKLNLTRDNFKSQTSESIHPIPNHSSGLPSMSTWKSSSSPSSSSKNPHYQESVEKRSNSLPSIHSMDPGFGNPLSIPNMKPGASNGGFEMERTYSDEVKLPNQLRSSSSSAEDFDESLGGNESSSNFGGNGEKGASKYRKRSRAPPPGACQACGCEST